MLDQVSTSRRVAFVLSGLGPGGAEGVIAKISERLVQADFDVTVIAFDRPDQPVFHAFHENVRLIRLALPPVRSRLGGPANIIRRFLRLRRTLRRERFDVVISFLTKINALTLAASAGTGTPVIVSERNNPLLQPNNRLWSLVLKPLYPRAHAIVLLTDASRSCLPPRERTRAVVIRNPAAPLPFELLGADGTRCVGVGRLTRQKGFDLLITAFSRIADRFPDWELVIWGEGPDRPLLEAQVRQLGLEGRVTLPGVTAKPGAWVESAAMLVLSSRYEGGPNVVIEAMATGLPVIATRCDFGPSELIDDGQDGLLVPPEDPEALASAMARMMADRRLRAELASAGHRRMIADASIDRVVGQWVDVIGSALRSRASEHHRSEPAEAIASS
ncbi:glycosyltransferase family 4 protein [Sphingomonas arenae]|uniref:glycosyltransferase family 4 protein n=1 Tax=Sphingomonas arenae TaxID=2812555 RepID=UPI001967B0FF|nr:glycosyltransferase family 4 protein [Sphingomonas arenae]